MAHNKSFDSIHGSVDDIKNLSDRELRRKLTRLKCSVGPITSTTRSVYEKKLRRLIFENELKESEGDVIDILTDPTLLSDDNEDYEGIDSVDGNSDMDWSSTDNLNLNNSKFRTNHKSKTKFATNFYVNSESESESCEPSLKSVKKDSFLSLWLKKFTSQYGYPVDLPDGRLPASELSDVSESDNLPKMRRLGKWSLNNNTLGNNRFRNDKGQPYKRSYNQWQSRSKVNYGSRDSNTSSFVNMCSALPVIILVLIIAWVFLLTIFHQFKSPKYMTSNIARGDYKCFPEREDMNSPRLGRMAAYKALEPFVPGRHLSPVNFRNVLFILSRLSDTSFPLKMYDIDGNQLPSDCNLNDIAQLESTKPRFSFLCTVRYGAQSLMNWSLYAVYTIFGIGCLWLFGFLLCRMYVLRRDSIRRRRNRIDELKAYILGMLHQQHIEHLSNPTSYADGIPVKSILTELKARFSGDGDVAKLWPVVSREMLDTETSMAVEDIRGVGETWRWDGSPGWCSPSSASSESNSDARAFQQPPTECLKISNMYTYTADMNKRDEYRIKRELIQKIIPCGNVYHIGLYHVGSKGFVYLLCENSTIAGRIYDLLKGQFFDGKILNLKFLAYRRYLEKFPEAEKCVTPLRKEF